MPTYSYLCTECAHDFDIHQAFTDDSLTVCPVCGGQLRKVFNSIGVTFNGPGFYRTDSRAAASDKISAERKSTEKKSEHKSEHKSEQKPSDKKDSPSSSGRDGASSSRKEPSKPKDAARPAATGSSKPAA